MSTPPGFLPIGTGPDLGFDGAGALRVVSARRMPVPAAIAADPGWVNGLRLDPANGAWAAQCAPTPVSETVALTGVTSVPAGTAAGLGTQTFTVPNPSAAQVAILVGDVQLDAYTYTNSSAWAELTGSLGYVPYPGYTPSGGYATPTMTLDQTTPYTPLTQAEAEAGDWSFVWNAQGKIGFALACAPGGDLVVSAASQVANRQDAYPSAPVPLLVTSWTIALNGVLWLVDPTAFG